MNRFVNNFTQMVFSQNLTNPRVGSKKIPKIIFTHIANDHPSVDCGAAWHIDNDWKVLSEISFRIVSMELGGRLQTYDIATAYVGSRFIGFV